MSKKSKEIRTLTAKEGYHFAYKDENDNIVELGSILYLGCNDDGSRYFEIEDKEEEEEIENDK